MSDAQVSSVIGWPDTTHAAGCTTAETHHFVFLIEGVPVRFFRGDAAEPSKRTLWRQESEAQQLALALGDANRADGLMFRLAVETDEAGEVTRVVFLALRGEEGQVECFWPVPAQADGPAPKERRDSAAASQLPLSAAAKAPRRLRPSPPKALADPHPA